MLVMFDGFDFLNWVIWVVEVCFVSEKDNVVVMNNNFNSDEG